MHKKNTGVLHLPVHKYSSQSTQLGKSKSRIICFFKSKCGTDRIISISRLESFAVGKRKTKAGNDDFASVMAHTYTSTINSFLLFPLLFINKNHASQGREKKRNSFLFLLS